MTNNLNIFQKDYLEANSWAQRKDGVPLDLLDKLTAAELGIAETALIKAASLGDSWPIIGLGHIKSRNALPTLRKLLAESKRNMKVTIAHSIFQICRDESMLDLVLEELPQITNHYEIIDILYMLPDFNDDRVTKMLHGFRAHKEYLVAYNATRVLGLPTDEVVARFRTQKTQNAATTPGSATPNTERSWWQKLFGFNMFFMIFVLFLSTPLFAQNKTAVKNKHPFVIGETVEIQSSVLKETRVLNVYLPQGYSKDSLKNYPVIYLLDGSTEEDFIHIAGLVQFGSFEWIHMIPKSIVVGIANIDRKRDFTFPTNNQKDKKDFPTTGGSEKFIQFIEKELQPFVKENYKTDSTRTLIGQSLGGLLATEILFKKPELFDNYMIVSPSLWWDDESLLKLNPKPYSAKKSIYVAVGKEGKIMTRDAKALYAKLKHLKNEKTALYFDYFDRLNHGDALHLAAYNGFQKIFQVKGK